MRKKKKTPQKVSSMADIEVMNELKRAGGDYARYRELADIVDLSQTTAQLDPQPRSWDFPLTLVMKRTP